MEIEVKKKAIKKVVDLVFMPQVAIMLNSFLVEFEKVVKQSTELEIIVGRPVVLPNKKIVLNLAEPTRQLIKNLEIIITTENETTQKEN